MPFPLEVIPSALGALGSIFNDEEGEREKRYRRYLDIIHKMKQQDIERATKRTSGLIAGARQAALARAAAAGRTGESESYILPAEQGAMREGNIALDRAIQPYNEQELNVEQDYANRPIQPGFGDFLSEAGGAVGNYLQNRRYLDITNNYGRTRPQSEETTYEDITDSDNNDFNLPSRRRRNLMLQY